MKNLIKIGLIRLYKNLFYLLGCGLAFIITYWFLTVRPIPQLASYSADNVAILLSGAIVVFFSMFIGLFMGSENEDGILRNKVMAGHTQLEAYFSHYITLLAALTGMMICWFLGAVAGGTVVTSDVAIYCLVAFLYNAAYIAVVEAIVFRLKKHVNGIIIPLGLAYFLLTCVLLGNFAYYMLSEQPALARLVAIVYNLSPLGQCFARTELADPGLGTTGMQVSISLVITALALLIGTLRLKKRDIN